MALVVATWLWGAKYTPAYVERLYAGLKRNLAQPFRFMVMTERERDVEFSAGIERHAIKDPEFTKVKGCFARLRMFDPGWQQNRDIADRLVCLDLDMVITGSCDVLFDRPEKLVVLKGANASNPCPFNCSVMMLRRGSHPELWREFKLERRDEIPHHQFPDDQGWLYKMVPQASGWHVGRSSGIYAFQKPGWPDGSAELPEGARIVAFPGWRDPSEFITLPWIRKHWIN